jgi:hypothetical protein
MNHLFPHVQFCNFRQTCTLYLKTTKTPVIQVTFISIESLFATITSHYLTALSNLPTILLTRANSGNRIIASANLQVILLACESCRFKPQDIGRPGVCNTQRFLGFVEAAVTGESQVTSRQP